MNLNKILKKLILIMLVIIINSCSSYKSNNYSDKFNVNSTINNIDYIKSNNTLLKKQVKLNMQKLQQNNTVYFNLDKYDICYESIHILNIHADFLHNNPMFSVVIEGHTDEKGTPEYNIALGEQRARAVKLYLQSKGVCENQITIVSYGKEKPVVLGHDEIAYSRNRRAVLIY